MKKFKISYILVLVFILTMIITKGFAANLYIHSYNDIDRGILDGFQGNIFISIYNCLIVFIVIIASILITFNKTNKTKNKILLLIILIFLSTYIPIGKDYYSGGVAGISDKKNVYIWNIITYFIK